MSELPDADLRKFRVPRREFNLFPLRVFKRMHIEDKAYVLLRTFDIEDDSVAVYATENPSIELPLCNVFDLRAACEGGIKLGYLIESSAQTVECKLAANFALFQRRGSSLPNPEKMGKRSLQTQYNLPYCRVFVHRADAVCLTLDVDTMLIQRLL